MKTLDDRKYTKTHEWARVEKDGSVRVGITDHAQEQLGDLVFIEPPQPGQRVTAGKECAVVESVKAAADIYAPISGTVIAANADAAAAPEKVNEDAFSAWLFSIKPDNPNELAGLLDANAYRTLVESEAH